MNTSSYLRNAKDSITGFAIVVGACALIGVLGWIFITGATKFAEIALPWLIILSAASLAICVAILSPLSLFKTLRKWTGNGFVFISYVFGINGWCLGVLLTWSIWGKTALFFGLFLAGVGVVPIALLATLLKGKWLEFCSLLACLLLTFGSRIFGAWLVTKSETGENGSKSGDHVSKPASNIGIITVCFLMMAAICLVMAKYEYISWKQNAIALLFLIGFYCLIILLLPGKSKEKTNQEKLNVLFRKGYAEIEKHKYENAVVIYQRILEIDPDDAATHFNLYKLFYDLKKYSKSLDHYVNYLRVNPKARDDDSMEMVDVLKEAAMVPEEQAKNIIEGYEQKNKAETLKATVCGNEVQYEQVLKLADEYLFSAELRNEVVFREFSKTFATKVPMRFYSIKDINIGVDDVFGFAFAFVAGGYAVAKASQKIMGEQKYKESLSEGVIKELASENEVPINYRIELVKKGNPIPWKMIRYLLEIIIDKNTKHIFSKINLNPSQKETVSEHIVRELVYTGYYIGIWQNVKR